jgi:hypothetical protein
LISYFIKWDSIDEKDISDLADAESIEDDDAQIINYSFHNPSLYKVQNLVINLKSKKIIQWIKMMILAQEGC